MRIRNGLAILRESWGILRMDPELLWFPVMSFIGVIAVIATIVAAGFLIPDIGMWALSLSDSFDTEDSVFGVAHLIGLALLFAIYFIEYFVVIYFNTAMVSCALYRFEGGDPTVSYGLQQANSKLSLIFKWTFVTAFVGTVLSAIEQRLGFVGKFIVNLFGIAWSVATYFVVPVLVAEELGPFAAVKRSVEHLKRTWGEGLTANFSLSTVTFLSMLLCLAVGAVVATLGAQMDSTPLMIFGISLAVALMFLTMILSSALEQILLAGLYRFATTDEVPYGYSEATLRGALLKK